MKKLILASAAATAFLAMPAMADTAETAFDITTNVAETCTIDGAAAQAMTVSVVDAAGEGSLLLDGNSSTQPRIWVSCNYGTTITVAGTELVNSDGEAAALADPDDFTNKIAYVIKLESGSAGGSIPQVGFTTKNGPATSTKSTAGAFHENAKLNVVIPRGDNPKRPVAGDYVATTTITLGAI